MSIPALTLSFSQTRLRLLLILMAGILLGIVLSWVSSPVQEAQPPRQLKAALPPKAPLVHELLLRGASRHPWRLFALLQESQVEGVNVQTLAWPGMGKLLVLTATTKSFTQIQAFQAKLVQQFGDAMLLDVTPSPNGLSLAFRLEVVWSH